MRFSVLCGILLIGCSANSAPPPAPIVIPAPTPAPATVQAQQPAFERQPPITCAVIAKPYNEAEAAAYKYVTGATPDPNVIEQIRLYELDIHAACKTLDAHSHHGHPRKQDVTALKQANGDFRNYLTQQGILQ